MLPTPPTLPGGLAFILILALIASAVSYSILPYTGRARPVIGAGDWNEASEPAEFPEEFGDFFSQYYTATENEKVEVRIPGGEEKLSFDLTLEPDSGEELTLQKLYQKCASSIVAIAGYTDGMTGYNWGTGVVLSSDGLVLTNTHVIGDCDSAEVVLQGEDRYDAVLVGADTISDLAVLKIEKDGLTPA